MLDRGCRLAHGEPYLLGDLSEGQTGHLQERKQVARVDRIGIEVGVVEPVERAFSRTRRIHDEGALGRRLRCRKTAPAADRAARELLERVLPAGVENYDVETCSPVPEIGQELLQRQRLPPQELVSAGLYVRHVAREEIAAA